MRNRLPMIFSITALLVALFGITPLGEAAYNAVVPKNSVGTPQLQRNAVKAAKIAPNAVRTGHVLDGSLLVADFKAGQIPQGPKGDKGDKGVPGPTEGVSAVDTTSSGPQVLTDQLSSAGLDAKFTTSTPGKLMLVKALFAAISCTGTAQWWWLTLDGSVVPGSLRFTAQTTALAFTLDGVTGQSVPAGEHTLGVGAMCELGSSGGSSLGLYSGGSVVVLG